MESDRSIQRVSRSVLLKKRNIDNSDADLKAPNEFTISPLIYQEYYDNNKKLTSNIEFQVLTKLRFLEHKTNKKYGFKDNPLLISISCDALNFGSSLSNLVINLGMNTEIVEELAESKPRETYNYYRKMISTYATFVKGYPDEYFNGYFNDFKKFKGYKNDTELTTEDLKIIIQKYKDNYLEYGGSHFPDNPKEQLMSTIQKIFELCNNAEITIKLQEIVFIDEINNYL